jgi:DNA-binding protein H-NS
MGFSLTELVGAKAKTTGAHAPAKFRHPENSALTWSGRGRKPRWFLEALSTGKTEDELTIT